MRILFYLITMPEHTWLSS